MHLIWTGYDAVRLSWWRHQMETFSALLAICVGNSPVSGEFPAQSPVTQSFDAFFDLRLNKQLSKRSWGWWFETLPRPLWRHSNGMWTKTAKYETGVLRSQVCAKMVRTGLKSKQCWHQWHCPTSAYLQGYFFYELRRWFCMAAAVSLPKITGVFPHEGPVMRIFKFKHVVSPNKRFEQNV